MTASSFSESSCSSIASFHSDSLGKGATRMNDLLACQRGIALLDAPAERSVSPIARNVSDQGDYLSDNILSGLKSPKGKKLKDQETKI